MTNHPRRANRRKYQRQSLGDRVVRWVNAYAGMGDLEAWQAAAIHRFLDPPDDPRDLAAIPLADWGKAIAADMVADPDDPVVAVGFDGSRGGDTVTVATMTAGGVLHVAPLGTDPASAAWRPVGHVNHPCDLLPWSDPDHDPVADIRTWIKDASKLDTRSITVKFDADVAALARLTAVPRMVMPIRGLQDNITGRPWIDDGMHPASLLEWRTVDEGLDADLMPLVVCEHCGEPAPCTEQVLRHMDTDGHRCFCRPTGTCTVTNRPVTDLPTR